MSTPFVFAQYVHFGFKLGVRGDRSRLGQHLPPLNFFPLGAAQQYADVFTRPTFVEQLAEHLYTRTGRGGGVFDTDNFDLFAHFDNAALDPAGHNGASPGDGEDVFDRHQEGAVNGALGLGNVFVEGFHQLLDGRRPHFVVVFAFQGHQRGANNNGGVVAGEFVLVEQFPHFHLDQFKQFFVIDHVGFVQKHDYVGYAHLTRQQYVLAGLGHGTVGCGAH